MARLLPAYARDVLSFLRYEMLHKCRIVSRALNNIVATSYFPARCRLGALEISVGGMDEMGRLGPISRISEENGYMKVSGTRTKDWTALQEQWGCCREEFVVGNPAAVRKGRHCRSSCQGCFKTESLSIVGMWIFPSHSADCFVQFRVRLWSTIGTYDLRLPSGIMLTVRNEMTTETAFGVLHLLDHLRGVAFEQHQMRAWSNHTALLLNPSIVRLLSLDKRGRKLCVAVHQYIGTSHVPRTSESLKASISHINIGELEWSSNNLSEVSNFTLTGKSYCRVLRLTQPAHSDFDSILEVLHNFARLLVTRCGQFSHQFQHFQWTLPAIGRSVVRELALRRIDWVYGALNDRFWPTRLPPKGQMERLQAEISIVIGASQTPSPEKPSTSWFCVEDFSVSCRKSWWKCDSSSETRNKQSPPKGS